MMRVSSVLVVAGLLAAAFFLVWTQPTQGYSDGKAGSSGAIPENLKTCQGGVPYCTVTMPGCGSCHGERDAMKGQRPTGPDEPANVPVVDRIQLTIKIGGTTAFPGYEPGQSYVVDLDITTDRARGPYTAGGFNLNVSGGRLERFPNDDTVRITGGLFQHAGSQNASYSIDGQPIGAFADDESDWAGEATHTRTGSDVRGWRVKWVAPGKEEPRGVAFQATFMVPNGNGRDDSCTYDRNPQGECDSALGYSDQELWDWWYFGTPLKIVCEKGQDAKACNEKVLASIRPPPPPRATCPEGTTACPTSTSEGSGQGSGTPVPANLVFLAVLLAATAWARRRRV